MPKIGETVKAIATAKKSLEGAKAAKNEAYIKMNSESLKELGSNVNLCSFLLKNLKSQVYT